MINFSENTELLSSLLHAENVRNRCANLRISKQVLGKLRQNNFEIKSFYLCKLQGLIQPDVTFENYLDIQKNNGESTKKIAKDAKKVKQLLAAAEKIQSQDSSSQILSIDMILHLAKCQKSIETRDTNSFGVITSVLEFPYSEISYIPPKAKDIVVLLGNLCEYVNKSSDHPIVKASTTLYEMLTIWPFNRWNVILAHIISDLVLAKEGFLLYDVSSLEQTFFEQGKQQYESCLNMGLPNFYYSGRNNPPKPDLWHKFYLECVNQFASQAYSLLKKAGSRRSSIESASLNASETKLAKFLIKSHAVSARPVDIARYFNVTNKTATNWLKNLTLAGLVRPNQNSQRITEYSVLL